MFIKLSLHIKVPQKPPQEFELVFEKEKITIGRSADNDIQLPLREVSRYHAQLSFEKEGWFLEDLNSSHGTKINENYLKKGVKVPVKENDVIIMGHAVLTPLSFMPSSESASNKDSLSPSPLKAAISPAANTQSLPYLLITTGALQGEKIEILPSIREIVLGRSETADVSLNDSSVSRQHAVLRRLDDRLVLEDLDSKNGLVINGQIRKNAVLQDSDEIALGNIRFTFIDPAASILQRLSQLPTFITQHSPFHTQPELLAPSLKAAPPESFKEDSDESKEQKSLSSSSMNFLSAAPVKDFSSVSLNRLDYIFILCATLLAAGIIVGAILVIV